MKHMTATVRLDHDDILAAIREHVARKGWQPGEVTVACSPHQLNGPDTFSATVDVVPSQPVAIIDGSPKSIPHFGQTSTCKSCNRPITFDGRFWGHDGEPKPRHPAIPLVIERPQR